MQKLYDSDNIITTITDELSLFDGSVYTVLVRKNNVSDIFINNNVTICGSVPKPLTQDVKNSIPTHYDLIVKKSTSGEISLESSSSIIVADGYNESFRGENFTSTIGNVYVGNHTQLVSTITPDQMHSLEL